MRLGFEANHGFAQREGFVAAAANPAQRHGATAASMTAGWRYSASSTSSEEMFSAAGDDDVLRAVAHLDGAVGVAPTVELGCLGARSTAV